MPDTTRRPTTGLRTRRMAVIRTVLMNNSYLTKAHATGVAYSILDALDSHDKAYKAAFTANAEEVF